VAFSPDGRVLAVGFGFLSSRDGGVRLYDAATGAELRRLAEVGRGRGVRAVAFSPDGRMLAVADKGGFVGARLYDAATGAELARCSLDAPLQCCAWHPSESWIAVGDALGTLHDMRVEGL
jgi:WD40 repeat protein